MFESNFPVDIGSCDYATLWNAFKVRRQGLFGRREDGAVQRHGEESLPAGGVTRGAMGDRSTSPPLCYLHPISFMGASARFTRG